MCACVHVCVSTTSFPGDSSETKEAQEKQVCVWSDRVARNNYNKEFMSVCEIENAWLWEYREKKGRRIYSSHLSSHIRDFNKLYQTKQIKHDLTNKLCALSALPS